MSSNGSNSTAARNNHRSRSSQNGAVNRSNTNNSSQYKKKQHQSNRSNKNSLQLTTQEKESEEILSNREIQSKRDNIMKDEDIKNILQDVQAYSIPHFENMDLNLVNEIRQIYKDNLNSLQEGNRQGMNNSTNSQPNNSKNLGTGGGWSVLSDILSKYPKHQSVAVVIKKLREEAKQEQLMKESSDKRKDRKLGKFKSASKVNNLTLKDFKTSEAADKSEHFRNIQLNLKQLEIIKDDFKRLKEIDKDQKLWLNRFMLKQNLIHKKVQYKRQDGIQKPLTIDKIIASSLNGGGQAQNALNSNLAKYDTLKSIISDDRKQSLQLDSSITVTNHKHQKQTNNNDQFHNNHNKNHTQMQKQPYLEYDAINRRELRSNQLSSRQAKTALQGGKRNSHHETLQEIIDEVSRSQVYFNVQKDQDVVDHRKLFSVTQSKQGGFVKVLSTTNQIIQDQHQLESKNDGIVNNKLRDSYQSISMKITSDRTSPKSVYQQSAISRRDSLQRRYQYLQVKQKQYHDSLENSSQSNNQLTYSKQNSIKNSTNNSLVLLSRRQQLQSNTLARGIQDEIKEVYEDAAMSPDYTQSKKSRIQSAQMQRRQKPRYDYTMELFNTVKFNFQNENSRYQTLHNQQQNQSDTHSAKKPQQNHNNNQELQCKTSEVYLSNLRQNAVLATSIDRNNRNNKISQSHVISHRKKYPIIENNNSKTITQDYSLNLISTPSELNNNNLRLPLNNQILTNQTQKNKYLNINELVKSIQHDSSLDKLDSTLQSPISNQNQKPIHISRRIIKPSFVEQNQTSNFHETIGSPHSKENQLSEEIEMNLEKIKIDLKQFMNQLKPNRKLQSIHSKANTQASMGRNQNHSLTIHSRKIRKPTIPPNIMLSTTSNGYSSSISYHTNQQQQHQHGMSYQKPTNIQSMKQNNSKDYQLNQSQSHQYEIVNINPSDLNNDRY